LDATENMLFSAPHEPLE